MVNGSDIILDSLALRVRMPVVPLLSVRAPTGFENRSGQGTYGKQCRTGFPVGTSG
jgi:hypothetical protein